MSMRPERVEDLQNAVRQSSTVAVLGAGTKSEPAGTLGDGAILTTTGFDGIVDYSPDECVLTAKAGTRIADIMSTLGAHGQYLPFDPPFAADGATLGGTVAAGLSGPRRYRYGGVRDFVIGARIVDGEGRFLRSGGKVVKNAAGFLLHHAIVGSAGTFGVIAEVSVKVFPAPEARHTIAADCGSPARAFFAARSIERFGADCEAIDFDHRGRLVVTIAGRHSALAARVARLREFLRSSHPDAVLVEGDTEIEPVSPTQSWVKVAGAMPAWEQLQPHVMAARFMCAGAAAWLSAADLAGLDRALAAAQLQGTVFRGPGAGRRVGHWPANVFEERLRAVLDPGNRFRAASHSRS